MANLRRVLLLVAAGLLSAAACAAPAGSSPSASGVAACPQAPVPGDAALSGWLGQGTGALAAVIVTTEQACGENRFVFSFLDAQNRPVAAPDREASVELFSIGDDPDQPRVTAVGEFFWAIDGSRGVYRATVTLDRAGLWGGRFTLRSPGQAPQTARLTFEVRADRLALAPGDRAPRSRTVTLAEVGGDLARISSDPSPVAAFYERSLDQAIADGRPFVAVFATPRFCTGGQCGPTLEVVKPVAARHPNLVVINVEPYQLELVGSSLQPVVTDGKLTPVAATQEWKLLTEPWTFVVDGAGLVSASLEGPLSSEELEAAVEAVLP